MSEGELPDRDATVPRISGLPAAILGESEVILFENLYVAYAAEARGLAWTILSDPELAADAVHTGFLEMLHYLVRGQRWCEPTEARGMVLRNVRWAALNIRRTRRRLLGVGVPVDAALVDDAQWARAEARALCEEIVGRLSANHQAALRLRYVEGLSMVDAAARLEIRVDVFEARTRRALRAARRVAGEVGLMPQLAALWQGLRRRLSDRARSGRRVAGMAAQTAALAAAFAVTAQIGLGSGPAQATWGSHARLMAGVAADSIDDSLVLDAVALDSASVLVRGVGDICHCALTFRSSDGGATWSTARGSSGLPAAGHHAQACGTPSALRFCRHAGGVMGPDAGGGAGWLLVLATHHMLYFRPSAGVICSADAGLHWSPRCPSISG